MARQIAIDPITRLEGHGKIQIFLDDEGAVEDCYFQIPELRGFERFVEGRPIEDSEERDVVRATFIREAVGGE